MAEEEWELRPAVTAIWTGPARRAARSPGARSSRRPCSATARPCGPPRVAARALAVLRELGLVEVGEDGVRAAADPERRELDDSPLYRACRARLEEARAFLALAPTLDLLAARRPGAGRRLPRVAAHPHDAAGSDPRP